MEVFPSLPIHTALLLLLLLLLSLLPGRERKERGRAQKQVAKSGQPGRALAAGRCRSSAGRGPAVLLTLRGKPATGIGCTGKPYREEASEVD